MVKGIIDPSDPNSPLVWYELRRKVFANPVTTHKIQQATNSLSMIALPVLVLLLYIVVEVFVLKAYRFFSYFHIALILVALVNLYPIIYVLKVIISCFLQVRRHKRLLHSYKEIVTLVLQNQNQKNNG